MSRVVCATSITWSSDLRNRCSRDAGSIVSVYPLPDRALKARDGLSTVPPGSDRKCHRPCRSVARSARVAFG
jgi:hypothetical protein